MAIKRKTATQSDDDCDWQEAPRKSTRKVAARTTASSAQAPPPAKRTLPIRSCKDPNLIEEKQKLESIAPPPSNRKRKVRPPRATAILPLSFPNETLKEKYHRNEKESRLLSLPPEIRTRIWQFVFGGNTVHMYNKDRKTSYLQPKRKLYRSICMRKCSDHEKAETIEPDGDGNIQLENHDNRHKNCILPGQDMEADGKTKRRGPTMNLQVLETSRMVHDEACLIPFESNIFSFTWILDFEGFVEHLLPEQVSAVQHINFNYHFFWSDDEFEERLAQKLVGLKSLLFFVELQSPRYWDIEGNGADSQRFANHKDTRDMVAECLLRFQRFPVKSAKVVAHNAFRVEQNQQHVPGAITQPWCKAIEDKLMAEWKGEEEETESDSDGEGMKEESDSEDDD